MHRLLIRRRPGLSSSLTMLTSRCCQRKPDSISYRSFSSSFLSLEKDGKKNEVTPVTIVGGGPSGLFLALLLQKYAVPFTLLEQQSPEQKFRHPQAHFMNTRTMELLKHGFPSLYQNIQDMMAPVDEWKAFYFGPSIPSNAEDDTKCMAYVVHPVDRPILALENANGKLMQGGTSSSTNRDTSDGTLPLSDCSVGHLAQHTFSKLLYDQVSCDNPKSEQFNIRYNTALSCLERQPGEATWTVHTSQNESFQTNLVIAADGANSFVRSNYMPSTNMQGTPIIQHLINVHFEISNGYENMPKAMLYTIFSTKAVAMMVRHGPGEFVLQVPYFPPFQTLEEDFSRDQVLEMLQSMFEDLSIDNFRIHSIRPWTMGSLVSDQWYSDDGTILLVGDSAHVFPPAGGFGMNTGLQDTVSLAWRIAHHYHSNEDEKKILSEEMGRRYQNDRQPVARQNAALSVRNYQRVLEVMKSCYLNDQYPQALISVLNGMSAFTPLWVRQQTFRSLLKTALMPLGQLHSPSNPFKKHVTYKLQRLLKAGQGLPLVFPNNEIGFKYASDDGEHTSDSEPTWEQDTFASLPKLANGCLFPHLEATLTNHKALADHSINRFISDQSTISTRDLPLQFHIPGARPTFVALSISSQKPSNELLDMLQQLIIMVPMDDPNPLLWAHLQLIDTEDSQDTGKLLSSALVHLQVDRMEWQSRKLPTIEDGHVGIALIRPDGHVASFHTQNIRKPNIPQVMDEIKLAFAI